MNSSSACLTMLKRHIHSLSRNAAFHSLRMWRLPGTVRTNMSFYQGKGVRLGNKRSRASRAAGAGTRTTLVVYTRNAVSNYKTLISTSFCRIMSSSNSHTILLVMPSHKPTSRTFTDFETLTEALEGGKLF